jgi:hypothetical protein
MINQKENSMIKALLPLALFLLLVIYLIISDPATIGPY